MSIPDPAPHSICLTRARGPTLSPPRPAPFGGVSCHLPPPGGAPGLRQSHPNSVPPSKIFFHFRSPGVTRPIPFHTQPGQARSGYRHEGRPAEMTVLAPAWSPATPLLLLLLLSPGFCGTPDCTFPHSPISSTFADTIRKLSDYLLEDYPVTVATNLHDDKLCWAFWRLVLAQRCMERLKTVAGSQMQQLLEDVNTEIYFVTSCALQPIPSCLRYVQTNISHLLQDTSEQLVALKPWITRWNFSGCLELRCQPDSSTLLPSRSPKALEATALPAAQAPLLLLLLLLPLALLLVATVWCLDWRRRRRRTPDPGEQRTLRPRGRSHLPEDTEPGLGASQLETGPFLGSAAPATISPGWRQQQQPAPAPAPPAALCT